MDLRTETTSFDSKKDTWLNRTHLHEKSHGKSRSAGNISQIINAL